MRTALAMALEKTTYNIECEWFDSMSNAIDRRPVIGLCFSPDVSWINEDKWYGNWTDDYISEKVIYRLEVAKQTKGGERLSLILKIFW